MFLVIERIEEVVYAMFFVLAGLHFDLGAMKAAGILALLIVLGRSLGKYFGTRAGVTMGLVLLAKRAFPTFGAIMVNAVLASVIINELIAPLLIKYALFKSGEAHPDAD